MNKKGYKALKNNIKYVEYNNSLTLYQKYKDVFAKTIKIAWNEMNIEFVMLNRLLRLHTFILPPF